LPPEAAARTANDAAAASLEAVINAPSVRNAILRPDAASISAANAGHNKPE
jgi:hypothetical protein